MSEFGIKGKRCFLGTSICGEDCVAFNHDESCEIFTVIDSIHDLALNTTRPKTKFAVSAPPPEVK
jgi:hypothetical protein